MNLEYYSSAALVTSVVVYLLAMTAYAAEWAAARKAPVEEAADRRELASVGASSGSQGGETSPKRTSADADVEQRMAEMKVELWGRIGVALTVVGFFCSIVGTTLRGLAAGRPP
ncbi:MAG TPA: c-type cytochrome biogenesis protein CcsB, partial [Microlunatus sp.]